MTPHSTSRYTRARAVSALLVLCASVVAALTVTGTAVGSASSKCGDQVLADWFDNGRIDRLYPLHCYEEAIDAIPVDVRDYSDAEQVISRALQAALSGNLDEGGCDPTPDAGSKNPCRNAGGPANGGTSDGTGSNGNAGDSATGDEGTEAVADVDTSGPSSLPIPLLILGGVALALLAAGALGYVSRRRQAAEELGDGDDDSPTLA